MRCMKKTEVWKPVVDFEETYEVSSFGRVRKIGSDCDLPAYANNNGRYRAVTLYRSGKSFRRRVHRLVAEAHLSNPKGLPMVLHRDDVGSNNTVDNLYWGTRAQNTVDAIKNGKHPHANKTHCKRGHEFTEDNIYHTKDGRSCRVCRRIHNGTKGVE